MRGRAKFELKNGKYQPVLREEHVLKEIVERLWLQAKIKVWRIRERIPVKGKRWQALSTPGIPDLVGWAKVSLDYVHPEGKLTVLLPIPVFIEVKRPGGARRPAQERFIAEARSAGCIAGFCESWDDVLELLKAHKIEVTDVS